MRPSMSDVERVNAARIADHVISRLDSPGDFPCCDGLEEEEADQVRRDFDASWLGEVTRSLVVAFDLIAVLPSDHENHPTLAGLLEAWIERFQERVLERPGGLRALQGMVSFEPRALVHRGLLQTCFLVALKKACTHEEARAPHEHARADLVERKSELISGPAWDAFALMCASWSASPLLDDRRRLFARFVSDLVRSEWLVEAPDLIDLVKDFAAAAAHSLRVPFTPVSLASVVGFVQHVGTLSNGELGDGSILSAPR